LRTCTRKVDPLGLILSLWNIK